MAIVKYVREGANSSYAGTFRVKEPVSISGEEEGYATSFRNNLNWIMNSDF